MRPIPKRRRIPLTLWTAVALVCAAGIVSAAWALISSPRLDALAPNVITELTSIAITVSIIEWVLRRQAQERLRPRTDDVSYWMGLSFRLFTMSIVREYATTHIATIKEIPKDATQLFALWEAELSTVDEPSQRLEDDWLPVIVHSAIEFEQDLSRARERDIDVLEPDLVRAIDNFRWNVGQCVQMHGFARGVLADDAAGTEATGIAALARGSTEFAEVFRQYGEDWFEILDLPIRAALESREHIARTRADAA